MKMVADTNTFLAVALREPERDGIIAATAGHDLLAPDVLPYEMGNALIAMNRRGRLTTHEVHEAWKSLQAIPVDLRAVDIELALQLAIQCQVYAYDAYFLACAVSMHAPILTLDKGMQRSARILEIPLVEITP